MQPLTDSELAAWNELSKAGKKIAQFPNLQESRERIKRGERLIYGDDADICKALNVYSDSLRPAPVLFQREFWKGFFGAALFLGLVWLLVHTFSR